MKYTCQEMKREDVEKVVQKNYSKHLKKVERNFIHPNIKFITKVSQSIHNTDNEYQEDAVI